MRKLSWVLGLAMLTGLTVLAAPAGAVSSASCGDGVPHSSYTARESTITYALPLAPCRAGRHAVVLAMSVSLTRCAPVVGCGFARTAHKQCRGTSGTCVLVLHAPHDAVEVANYYVQSNLTVVSGNEVWGYSASSSGGLPCASAVVTTLPTC